MLEFWIPWLAMLLCGVIASASLIISKRPDARQMLDKLAPHQGWIGLVGLILGVVHLVQILRVVDFSNALLRSLLGIAAALVLILLGFLLSFPILSKFLFKAGTPAAAKGEALRAKVAGMQGPLGLAALAFCVLWLLMYMGIIK